jgi:HK97 family phage portal protein
MNRLQRAVTTVVDVPLNLSAQVLRGVWSAGTTMGGYFKRTDTMKWWKSGGNPYRTMNRTDYDYEYWVGDASTNSAVVAAVGWMARNFPEAPVRISRSNVEEGEGNKYIKARATGPGRMLQLLERPNPYYSGVVQWMATITDFKCTGNAYWLKVRNSMGRVDALWWLPSWMTEPRWDEGRSDQFVGWYEYTIDGVTWGYDPRDIIHFRDGLDKYNPRKGLSALASLFREIYTDDEASNLTASLMRNLGVPGIVLSPANTTGPTGRFKDPEEMKETFMAKFSGDKRGEPFVSSVPVDLKVASWSPEQMNLRDLRKIPEERITAVIGVAAIVAGLGAGLDRSTFSNFSEARKAAYEESILPAQRLMSAELEVQLLDEFADLQDYDVDFDWSKATAMQENAADVWKRNQEAAVKGLITRSQFKQAVGLPVEQGDDVYVVPSNMLFVTPGKTPQTSLPKPPEPLLLPKEKAPQNGSAPRNGATYREVVVR